MDLNKELVAFLKQHIGEGLAPSAFPERLRENMPQLHDALQSLKNARGIILVDNTDGGTREIVEIQVLEGILSCASELTT